MWYQQGGNWTWFKDGDFTHITAAALKGHIWGCLDVDFWMKWSEFGGH